MVVVVVVVGIRVVLAFLPFLWSFDRRRRETPEVPSGGVRWDARGASKEEKEAEAGHAGSRYAKDSSLLHALAAKGSMRRERW